MVGMETPYVCVCACCGSSLMFWTDWGDRAAGVYRAWMDGTNVSCIVSEGVRWPNGITADEHWLYWTEAFGDRIERADFLGGQRTVLVEGLPHPYAIAIFKVSLTFPEPPVCPSWPEKRVRELENTV